jgi:protein-disulfide isomerase
MGFAGLLTARVTDYSARAAVRGTMLAMRMTWKHAAAIVVAAILGAGLFVWSGTRAPSLSFQDRAYPQGFRELVLANVSSRLDPLAVLPGAEAVAARPGTPEVCEGLFRDTSSPAVGRRDAPVQIAAFLDYRCPYCRTLAGIMTAARSDSIRLIYKEWPILGEPSQLAARAALAANRQGRYPAFHARLMGTRLIPTPRLIEEMAAELSLDPARLRDDMRSPAIAAEIARNFALASALGFVGTPVLVIGRTIAQGDITRHQLERLIEEERAQPAMVC